MSEQSRTERNFYSDLNYIVLSTTYGAYNFGQKEKHSKQYVQKADEICQEDGF